MARRARRGVAARGEAGHDGTCSSAGPAACARPAAAFAWRWLRTTGSSPTHLPDRGEVRGEGGQADLGIRWRAALGPDRAAAYEQLRATSVLLSRLDEDVACAQQRQQQLGATSRQSLAVVAGRARTELGPLDTVDRQRGIPVQVRVAVDVCICGTVARERPLAGLGARCSDAHIARRRAGMERRRGARRPVSVRACARRACPWCTRRSSGSSVSSRRTEFGAATDF